MKDEGRQRLIIGLGNPGPEFENTYHNVGVLALEYLAKSPADGGKLEWKSHKKLFGYSNFKLQTSNFVFIRPLTFMNESGLAAKEALKKFNAAPEDLIVIHDDSDLALGKFKIAGGQRSAGHKGVQSVIDHVGTQDFERVKIGIREQGTENREQSKRKKAEDFVLSQITPKDKKILEKVFEEIRTRLFQN